MTIRTHDHRARRWAAALTAGVFGAAGFVVGGQVLPAGAAPPTTRPSPTGAPIAPLTNLAHLDFLLDTVPLVEVEGHTTYHLAQDPTALAPWTYADRSADGTFRRIGGGALDPATGDYGQGAFNADDIARSAVVYLRHWRLTGASTSRDHAVETLRALTYLQTTTGPDAGNVVLWQQSDGSLNPSAIPVELPDPSDSAESYWLARTVWALGEGYAAFQHDDAELAAFLQERLHLALDALERQSLSRYGTQDVADGVPVPGWLIAGGADASAEAVLGLAAYVRSVPDDQRATTALTRLTEGIAEMSAGDAATWPFGAILPWTGSRTFWHAWGGMAPAAVATASDVLHRRDLLRAAVRDSAQFTPQLLAAGGPVNLWGPTPGEAQIAYGADSRVQGLVATAAAARAPGLREVAAFAAAWFFGANPSGAPAYDPATGVAIDGIAPDGQVNRNSGAESTIHTLLTMLALDADPELRAAALAIDRTVSTDGLLVVEAESGTLAGAAAVTVPDSAWTGEAVWSGGRYVTLEPGGSVRIPVAAGNGERRVHVVVGKSVAPAGRTRWSAGPLRLGATDNGGVGEQGITAAPGMLVPLALDRTLGPRATSVLGRGDGTAAIDALLLQPLVASVSVDGPGGPSTLFTSSAAQPQTVHVDVPRNARLTVQSYNSSGRVVHPHSAAYSAGRSRTVVVAPGGFTVVHVVPRPEG